MAFRAYSINIRWVKTPMNVVALEAALTNSMAGGDWVRFSGFTYFIWTQISAEKISGIVRTVLKEKEDTVLVAAVDLTDCNGWAPGWIWDWLNERRARSAGGGGLLQPQQNRLTGL